MSKQNNTYSARYSLKYKLRVAVSLMTILPILACIYLLSNYVFPQVKPQFDIFIIIGVSFLIAIIGFFVIKQIFDRILSVTSEAKLIAAGDTTRKLDIPRDDEVGDLGDALNQLTQRIRSNMDELKNYGEKTNEINIEIQKRVLVLSSLLQISSLVSQSAPLDEILKLTTEKARLLANSEMAYLFLRQDEKDNFRMKVVDGIGTQGLFDLRVGADSALFKKLIQTNTSLTIDAEKHLPDNLRKEFQDMFKLKNMLALPIYVRGKVIGVLGIGNIQDKFAYRREDLELMDIFAKQAAIAVENDLLMHKVEKLEIKDTLTGLYNESFIRGRLQEEIKRAIAYQRPCALILFDIDNFKKFHDAFGALQSENVLKRVAALIRDSVSEVDRVARFSDNSFAVVLPEKNKRQAQQLADEIKKKIEFAFSEEPDPNKRITIIGVVTENPLDGISAEELINKGCSALSLGTQQRRVAV